MRRFMVLLILLYISNQERGHFDLILQEDPASRSSNLLFPFVIQLEMLERLERIIHREIALTREKGI
jgi:hypothetical protein